MLLKFMTFKKKKLFKKFVKKSKKDFESFKIYLKID